MIERYTDPYTGEVSFRLRITDNEFETIDPNLVEEDQSEGFRLKDPATLAREQARTQGILPLVDPGISQYNQQGGNFGSPEDFYKWLYGGGSVVNTAAGQGFQIPNYTGGDPSQYLKNDPTQFTWRDPSPGLSNPIIQAGIAAVTGGTLSHLLAGGAATTFGADTLAETVASNVAPGASAAMTSAAGVAGAPVVDLTWPGAAAGTTTFAPGVITGGSATLPTTLATGLGGVVGQTALAVC